MMEIIYMQLIFKYITQVEEQHTKRFTYLI